MKNHLFTSFSLISEAREKEKNAKASSEGNSNNITIAPMISIESYITVNITVRAMKPGTLLHPLQSTYDRKQARRGAAGLW